MESQKARESELVFAKKEIKRDMSRVFCAELIYTIGGMILLDGIFGYIVSVYDEPLANWWQTSTSAAISLLAAATSFCIILCFYCRSHSLSVTFQKRMTAKKLLMFVLLDFAIGTVAGTIGGIYEPILNIFGLSAIEETEQAAGTMNMIDLVYTILLAPIMEEIVFRGVIMRTLKRYGKWFAIVASALLFALMHGNIAQFLSPFAGALISGYVAMEYSLFWSILLHMIWNAISSILASSLANEHPGIFIIAALTLIIIGLICLFRKRKQAYTYRKANLPSKGTWKAFFVCPLFFVSFLVWITRIIARITPL